MLTHITKSRHLAPLDKNCHHKLHSNSLSKTKLYLTPSIVATNRHMAAAAASDANNNKTKNDFKCVPLKNPKKLSKFRTMATSIDVTDTETITPCPRGGDWQIHKFGGTCMASSERIKKAVELMMSDAAARKAVIVSAMGSHPSSPVKVTDLMLRMIDKAARSDYEFMTDLEALHQKYEKTAKELLNQNDNLDKYLNNLEEDVENLKAMLHAIAIGI